MRFNKKRWRTKTAAKLLAETGASSIEEAVIRFVESIRELARTQGFRNGLSGPPYDPWPLAAVLGVHKIGIKSLGFDGRILRSDKGLALEIDDKTGSWQRRRFTIAHEVGHLALWKLSGKVVKTTSRWNSRQSEIEDLCNKIASEVLAPQSDVLKQVTAFSIEKDLFALLNAPLQTKTASQTILDSIVHISNVFEVSLHFSAARIYEVYMPRFAIILVDSSEKKLVWCVGISHSNELLHAILSAFTSTDQRGSGSYSAASRQGERIRNFIWRRIKKHLVLAAVQK